MPRVQANGVELEYDEFGRRDGKPLIMIMGFAAQMILWHEDLLHQLADEGFRVIRFDNRDVGLSTWIDATPPRPRRTLLRALAFLPVHAPYTLSDMADDTAGLMDALGIDQAHILGVSMGGMIAQHLAIEHPDRVLSLTSIMSGPGTRRHMIGKPKALRKLIGPAPRDREHYIDLNEGLFRVIGGDFETDWDWVRKRAGLAWDRGHNGPGVMRHWAAMIASGSRLGKLTTVTAPTLVVHGKLDPLVPIRAGRATAKAIRGSRLVEIDRMGHDLSRQIWPQLLDEFVQLSSR